MTTFRDRPRIGVLGPNQCSPEEAQLGFEVGAELARRGAVLLCGGLGGMMEAAARGAKAENGLTIGMLPGDSDQDANEYIDLPLPTGLGAMRNFLLVRTCHAVIAVHGAYGTLSEIAAALRLKVRVVGLHSWSVVRDGQLDPGILVAHTAKEAVDLAIGGNSDGP